jgi:CRISPR-associated protein Csm1
MNPELVCVLLGCLLHDIGKPVQRARMNPAGITEGAYSQRHGAIGRRFLEDVWSHDAQNPDGSSKDSEKCDTKTDNQKILDAVSFHHATELREAARSGQLEADAPAYISYIADNIAAGADRRKEASEHSQWFYPKIALRSVYDQFGDPPGEKRKMYPPGMLDDREPINYPKTEKQLFEAEDYVKVVEKLHDSLRCIETTPEYVQSLLDVLEETLTYVPSSTSTQEAPDISLYDHLKLTGAFGSCIWHYLDSPESRKDCEQKTLKEKLLDCSTSFYQKQAFLLASFDISGIQNFVYTIHSSGAAKMLRARSFYLEMLCEHLVDELLTRLELTRANLIYSGGGQAYLILPNTPKCEGALQEFETQTNKWLLEHFQTALFVAFGWEPFSAYDVMRYHWSEADVKNESQRYTALYRAVSKQISEKKLARYTATQLWELNDASRSDRRECHVCYRVGDTLKTVKAKEGDDRVLCALCLELEKASLHIQRHIQKVSTNIQEPEFMLVGAGYALPLPFDRTLGFAACPEDADKARKAGARVYAKNRFYTGPGQGVHLWVGDYWFSRDFSEYAESAVGIKRLAVARLDVDNLGNAFTQGFSTQEAGKFNTISRTAAFSRQLSLFFRQHINYVLEHPTSRGLVPDGRGKRKITIIYSGGDDVFAVGSWNDVVEFAIELRDSFKRYTDGKLTLSGGIGMYPDKYPISVMAHETGDLESAAKNRTATTNTGATSPDKNSAEKLDVAKDGIALFSTDAVFGWDELRDQVIGEKLALLREFFEQQNERGKTFGYKLLELLRERDPKVPLGRQITLARWAYFLSRLEPRDPANLTSFRSFTAQLYEWFQHDSDARQLTAALELHVYSTRERDK